MIDTETERMCAIGEDCAHTLNQLQRVCVVSLSVDLLRCGAWMSATLKAEVFDRDKQIDLPRVAPHVSHPRCLAVTCPGCITRVTAPVPEATRSMPFGPNRHILTTDPKTFQALSYDGCSRPCRTCSS